MGWYCNQCDVDASLPQEAGREVSGDPAAARGVGGGGGYLEGADRDRLELKEEPPMRPPLRAAIASSGTAAPTSIAPVQSSRSSVHLSITW